MTTTGDLFDFVNRGRKAQAAVDKIIDAHKRYPEAPGFKDHTSETSRAAAAAIAPRAGTLRARVLAHIKTVPATADEVAAALRESVLAIRPRLSELRVDALIVDSGIRRKNASGKSAVVWRVIHPTGAGSQ